MEERGPGAPRLEDMGIRERVAYLIGLAQAQGAEGGAEARSHQFTEGILEVLAELAREVDELRADERTLTGRVRSLRDDLAELADEVFGGTGSPPTTLLHCEACGQAMRVLTADLDNDQVELVCPSCGHVVHGYDHGLDYEEDEDTLDSQRDE